MSNANSGLAVQKHRTNCCGICHGTIVECEETFACPACGLINHRDCWQENFGCGTYGCKQVNILKGPSEKVDSIFPPAIPTTSPASAASGMPRLASSLNASANQLPWEYLLLGASAFAGLLGLVLHGWPSLLFWIVTRLYRETNIQAPGRGLVLAAEAVSLFCFVLGQQLAS